MRKENEVGSGKIILNVSILYSFEMGSLWELLPSGIKFCKVVQGDDYVLSGWSIGYHSYHCC